MNEPLPGRIQIGVSIRLVVIVVVGCASAPPKPAVSLDPPIAACSGDARSDNPLAPVEALPRSARARRDEVRRELAAIEAALDAFDHEIAAAARASGPSRDEAQIAAGERIAIVRASAIDSLHPGAPAQLHRLAHAYYDALRDKHALERDYGPRHPLIIEATRRLDWGRGAFERQRNVELEEASALYDELAKLPRNASPARVRQARLRAIVRALDQFTHDMLAPTDAPAEVRLAVDRASDIARELDELAPSLGPKHPDMIRLTAQRDVAAADIKSSVAAAHDAIAREIALLDAPHPPSAIDGGKLAKRVELAARARELRRELDALSP